MRRPRLAVVVLLGVLGQVLTYLVTVMVARSVSIEAFEHYAAAAALFVLLVSAAPLGTEKLSLLVLPPLYRVGDGAGIRSFFRFVARRSLFGLIGASVLGLLWSVKAFDAPPDEADTSLLAFLVALAVLPAGVAAHVAFEVLTSLGRGEAAAALFRIVGPGTALIVVAIAAATGSSLGAAGAILAWGIGWAVVASWLILLIIASHPAPAEAPASTQEERARWVSTAWPLWGYRVALSVMTSAGVLALDVFGQPSDAVGGYAAAASIVGLMTVLVTSTNRIYARDLALKIHLGTPESLQAILRRRLTWMLPVTGLALTTLWLFSTELLALFGPELAANGVWPLRILACGAAVSMLFALTPTVLKYTERYGAVLRAVGLGAGLQVLLLVLLVPRYGPVGAAFAAAAGIAVKHLWLMTSLRAERHAAGP